MPATASRIEVEEQLFTFELATLTQQARAQEITDVPPLVVQQPTASLLERLDELGDVILKAEAWLFA